MDRSERIRAIVDFVNQHPESTASRAIRRRTIGLDPENGASQALQEQLGALDEETLTGYYYLVK
ncbi:MAG: hypothetical protein ACM3ZC_15680 [Bacteroidota bacterium]